MRTPRFAFVHSDIHSARRFGFRVCAGTAAALGLSLLLTACGGGDGGGAGVAFLPPPSGPVGNPDTPPADPPAQQGVPCASLAGMSIGAAQIGLPTQGATVTSATPVAAGDAGNLLGDYCRVRGTIQPVDASASVINFAVNLPEQWNQKTIHFGGGGFDGTLIDGTEVIRFGPADKPAPLALGYATYGDDSGHQSSSITDGKFAANDEQLANYGGDSLKKTHDVAQALVLARYAAKPKHAYFLGTSTGGRDALSYIQRWPLDYDGVIANEPALNYTGTRLSNVAVGRALYNNGGAGWMSVPQTLLVQNAVKDACDKLDGAVDNIVSNVESCRQLNTQILTSLRCPSGADTGDTCLSDAQLDTVRAIESPLDFTTYSLANGVKHAGGYNFLEGTQVAGPYTTRDLGSSADKRDANVYVTGDQWVKFFVTRNADFNTLTFDPLNPGSYAARVTQVSNLTDATNPDLSPFFGHGGKLIMLHGLADEVISNNSTIDYYKQVIAAVGQTMVDQSMRFYTVPGMGHGTGVFIPSWDSLAALEGWVEGGLAPATAVVVDSVAGTYGRTRPLCQYPAWPKYRGSGSLDAAVNYSCTSEVGNPLACPNLPAVVTSYKGGDGLGEELQVQIDPAAMAYTVTFNAALGGTARASRTGSLAEVENGSCNYTSAESGAVFTLGAGGVMSGGVNAPGDKSFTPLLAFQKTFDNVATPTDFKVISGTFNAAGVLQGDKSATAYRSTGKLRDAGTFQYCSDAENEFIVYDASCTMTEKGYITYNSTRGSYDVFTTPATGKAVTVGGTLSGSMVIGLVNGAPVPLHLIPASATPVAGTDLTQGLRILAPVSLASGAADGNYSLLSVMGENHNATVAGSAFNLGGSTATLSYSSSMPGAPVPGVAQAGTGRPGDLVFNSGVLVFVSADTTGSNAALEFGVRH